MSASSPLSANQKGPETLHEKAHRVLPAGTFGNVPSGMIISRGKGSRVWDENGKEYIDYLIGSGPMILGHGHPEVTAAVQAQLENGTTFFSNNPQGIELAEVIIDALPCADKVRFASSGSEADAFAIRLVRAYTRRDKILKFEGGYHGYSDYGLMSLAPRRSSNSSHPVPDSAGIPRAVEGDILIAPFNDADAVESLIREHRGSIAAVMMEPLQRLISPRPGFLEAVRELTAAHDILLVFDEVATGFRMAYGGAQAHYGVTPDLCTLGKSIGGGFPMSAIAGREDIMALFDASRTAPEQRVPQVGTFSGNPVAAAAGLATLAVLKRPGTYERFFATGERLMSGLARCLEDTGLAAQVLGVPSMFDVVFNPGEIRNYRDTIEVDAAKMSELHHLLQARGLLKSHAKYYVSIAIDETDIEQTIAAWEESTAIVAGR